MEVLYSITFFFLPGKKTFAEFSVKGNINAETTNGIDLSKRLVTLDTDQDIVVPYEFFTLHAEKNLNLGGTFDAVDLVALDSTALKELQDETSKSHLGIILLPFRYFVLYEISY